MNVITALRITPQALAAGSNAPPCDALIERKAGDAALNKALAITFECLLLQNTATGKVLTMRTAINAWERSHESFLDRLLNGTTINQSLEAWRDLMRTLYMWQDLIVDDFLSEHGSSAPIIDVPFAEWVRCMDTEPGTHSA